LNGLHDCPLFSIDENIARQGGKSCGNTPDALWTKQPVIKDRLYRVKLESILLS